MTTEAPNLGWIAAFSIAFLITLLITLRYRYLILNQPLLQISVRDLIILDQNNITFLSNAFLSSTCILRELLGPVTDVLASVQLFILQEFYGLLVLYYLSSSILRYLQVFHNAFLNNFLDSNIQIAVRAVNVGFTLSVMSLQSWRRGFVSRNKLYYHLIGQLDMTGIKPQNTADLVIFLMIGLGCSFLLFLYTEYHIRKLNHQDSKDESSYSLEEMLHFISVERYWILKMTFTCMMYPFLLHSDSMEAYRSLPFCLFLAIDSGILSPLVSIQVSRRWLRNFFPKICQRNSRVDVI